MTPAFIKLGDISFNVALVSYVEHQTGAAVAIVYMAGSPDNPLVFRNGHAEEVRRLFGTPGAIRVPGSNVVVGDVIVLGGEKR